MGADIFTTRAPEVSYLERGAAPPAPLYIGPNEALIVDTWSSTAPAALAIVARVLTPGGQVHTSRWSHTPNTDRTRSTTYHLLEEGFLLSLTVDATGAAYRRGHCWCQVAIQIGDGAVGVAHAQIIADYVTGAARLAWPGGQLRSSVEGPGLIRSITGTDPAAGAEITETVPTGAVWRVTSVYLDLVTDATVANRITQLVIDDGAATLTRNDSYTTQGASLTKHYLFAAGWQRQAGDESVVGHTLPTVGRIRSGYRIRTITASLQAGDNYSAPQIWVEEWIEP